MKKNKWFCPVTRVTGQPDGSTRLFQVFAHPDLLSYPDQSSPDLLSYPDQSSHQVDRISGQPARLDLITMMSCMVCKTMQSLFFSKCFVKSLIHHKIETSNNDYVVSKINIL